MALSPQLHIKQQQKLVMTPMLQQALKILQMNSLELSDLINQEIAENPLLEEVEHEQEGVAAEAEAEAAAEEGVVPESPEAEASSPTEEAAEAPDAPDPAEAPEIKELPESGQNTLESTDNSWEEYFDDNGTDYKGTSEKGGEEKDGFESFLSARPSLQEHLLAQLDAEDLEPEMRSRCEEIIGAINERGYFEGEALEGKAFEALRHVQHLDPSGVGARNLRECLLLQLEVQGLKGGLAWRLVSEHLEELERQKMEPLQKGLKVSLGEIREAEQIISSLEPNPGRPFGGEPNPAITVEAFIEKDPRGEWIVIINDRFFPRLGFNQYYRKMMRQAGGNDDETKSWLKNKYESAMWLIRGIESRQKTLRRVLEEIVDVQKGFFENGPADFQPLTLKDIAIKTGLHESTVSRVTSGKYVQTPRGVFELKYFFTSGLRTDSGEDASSLAVKEQIKDIVEDESRQSPLSDQDIAERLSANGVKIARRTVAKYREELGILAAHRRKEGR